MFFTNLVLYLKKGGLVAPLSQNCYHNCGERFLRPLIEIICPRVIISLGKAAYDQIVKQYHLDKIPFREAVEIEKGITIGQNIRLFPVYHCGAHGWNINRKGDIQINDWKKIRSYLDTLSP
jgi:uracil-DNA glycosylase